MKNENAKKIVNIIIIPTIIALAIFLIIYGFEPLIVTNDRWIFSGYDEADIIQHYSGWLSYRNSSWSFPLGLTKTMGFPNGTVISFTDSIPLFAIFFKLIRQILPSTFQYFGIYICLCIILQSISGSALVYHFTKNRIYSFIGGAFFCFSPIMIERAFRHTALASHFLILFSMLLYFKHKNREIKHTYIYCVILEVLAISIHPYFTPMVSIFMLATMLNDVLNKNYKSILYFINCLVVAYIVGCLIGVFGSGIDVSKKFGKYSMNLVAIFNPLSLGGYTWSRILHPLPITEGNIDGFNYLGFGILFSTIVVLIKSLFDIKKTMEILKNHCVLLLCMIFMTLFALSNKITLFDSVILEIPLPDILLQLCGIYRASSRMFYPVYYLIFLISIIFIYKEFNANRNILFLVIVLVIQLYDIGGCLLEKHNYFAKEDKSYALVDNNELNNVAKSKKYIVVDNCYWDRIYEYTAWAHKNDLTTYFTSGNRGDYEETYSLGISLANEVKEGKYNNDIFVLTSDKELAEKYLKNEFVKMIKDGDLFFLYCE